MNTKRGFLYALFGVVLVVVVFTRLYFPNDETGGSFGPQGPLPAFGQEGWINGPGPTPAELEGHVVVIDLWAFWCGPCKKAVPDLIKLQKSFESQGVVFLGATNEGGENLDKSQAFVKETSIPWPNAYGTEKLFDELSIEGIPTILVVARDGQIVWRGHNARRAEEAIVKALALKN
ncbi:MAG: hypothetical protein C0478_01490 [Planctomyces sp.]|nr:hypothetical protein [Planctomyces sp.]